MTTVQCVVCHRNFDVVPPAEERLRFAKRQMPNGVFVCADCCPPQDPPVVGGVWRESQ